MRILFALIAVLILPECIQYHTPPPTRSQYQPLPAPPPSLPHLGEYNVYFGDLHNHTSLSDGSGTPEQAYPYARDRGQLDFFGISDHEWTMTDSTYALTRRVADKYNEDNVFVTFWGFEWSSMLYGHVTVVGTDDFCYSSEPSDTLHSTFSGLCDWLSKRDGIATFNHPGRSTGSEFGHFLTPPIDNFVAMELWNKSASFSAYYYNDGNITNDNNRSFFDEALAAGWKIGAGGGGDNHWATWGTSTDARIGVLAEGLTRTEIFSALKARRFYSTLDKNIVMSFTAGNQEMGSTVAGSTHHFTLRAADADIEFFMETIIFNSKHDTVGIWPSHTTNLDISFQYSTMDNDYLYALTRQDDGDEAISSPIWITSE